MGLADRVLATASPGRGLLDVPLPWPAALRAYGTPPLDPGRLPDEELIRLAVGRPRAPAARRTPAREPSRSLRAVAAPVATPVPAARPPGHGRGGASGVLLAQGLVESDWRPTHVVIAPPVEVMMAEHWAAAVREGGILKWTHAVAPRPGAGSAAARRSTWPPSREPRGRHREPLHVVVARDAEEAARAGRRGPGGPARRRPAGVRRRSPCDLLRRRQPADRADRRARTACATSPRRLGRGCSTDDTPGAAPTSVPGVPAAPPLGPVAWQPATADRLRRAGYAVHGNPDDLAPREHAQSGTVDRRPHPRAGRHGLPPDLAPGRAAVTRRVLLHVGAPKTGTSFVQDILFTHREALRERGILYAADRHDAHFLAALDLMELPWGGLEREATGAWDRLAAEVRAWPGTAIISHEILGTASRLQVARALASLPAVRATSRDPHRASPRGTWCARSPRSGRRTSSTGAPRSTASFLDSLRRPGPQRRGGAVVLGRAGGAGRARPLGGVDPAATGCTWSPCPARRRSPTLLWERFAGLFGIDPARVRSHRPGQRLARGTRSRR